MRITRRKALGLFVLPVCSTVLVPSVASADEIVVRRIRDVIVHRRSARIVAKQAGLRNRSVGELLGQLCPNATERSRLSTMGDEEFSRWMTDAVRADFTDGELWTVDGWMLARSEVLISAIAAT